MNCLIIGASTNKKRYAYKAMQELKKNNVETFLFNPNLTEIEGKKVFNDFSEISEKIDTISIYVNPQILATMKQEILKLKPHRIIFNPGTEDQFLTKFFSENGISVQIACTLILLRTGQF